MRAKRMSVKDLFVLAGAILATGALLSCSSEADDSVSDPLEGVWLTSDVLMTFDGGEYEVALDPEQWDDTTDTAFEVGTYEVDGTTLTLTPGPPTEDMEQVDPDLVCVVGQVGVYEMAVSADGSEIELEVVSDDCTVRRNDFRVYSLKKVQS